MSVNQKGMAEDEGRVEMLVVVHSVCSLNQCVHQPRPPTISTLLSRGV